LDLLTEKINELEHQSEHAKEAFFEQTQRWKQQSTELEGSLKYWTEQHETLDEANCLTRSQLERTLAEKAALLAECEVLRNSNQKLHDSVESWKVLHEGMLQDLQVANIAMQESPIKIQAEKEVAMSLERRLEEMSHLHKKEREELIHALREETNSLREQQLSNTHLRQALNQEQEHASTLRNELQRVNHSLQELQAQLVESDRVHLLLDASEASLAITKQHLAAAERCRGEDLQLHELELKKLQGNQESESDTGMKMDRPASHGAVAVMGWSVVGFAGAFTRDKAELEGLWERRFHIVSAQLEAEVFPPLFL
jgi:chromosome segregation ATPase